ncbi:ASCH domain-containing protein [Enterococcus sp. DIV1298c]|uniref:ASCH domain-containing protein n=1 Tax=Candidatus Enterococcus mangumiae TaxID=2230878 RepID=A0ABZ2T2F6_9ENTE|nr:MULTISPECIES: ASCH domain-containing protein [unclassified Enterococcus]MBO0460461.1 ASCH domain-containing protein [Enterococcus sp. DIV1298c]MBO0490702.1 ASCH domain-containing protein [Enterococcus sp. DIV1094]
MNLKAQEYWEHFCSKNGVAHASLYEILAFGNTKEHADELADLVLAGKKTGTSSGYELYQIDNEPLPKVGDYSVVVNGSDVPMGIIQTVEVAIVPWKEITEEQAATEGEGDLSLAYWQKGHYKYFKPYYEEHGLLLNEETKIVFERFRLVDRYQPNE